MRAAPVRLNSTTDRDRNLGRRTGSRAPPPRRAPISSSCPRSGQRSRSPAETTAGAEPLDGPALTWARDVARELGIDLVAGSIAERVEGARGRNTSVHFGPDGEAHATYRKIHMFDVEVGGTTYRESDTDEPGDEVVLSSTAGGVELGLSICYDLRFPELYRELARAGRGSSPSRPPSRSRPRASTGRCCCAPARSRIRSSSWPPTRSGSTRRASARAGAR